MPNQFLSPEGDLENYFVTEYWLIDQYVGDTLWTWGYNGSGGLGNNTIISRSTPATTFAGGTNWRSVGAGYDHMNSIKTDGTLWVWGDNSLGELGINNTANRSTPVTTFAGGTNWKQVSGGRGYSAAIKTDGTLWTWGYNVYGMVGDNTTTQRNTPVTTFAGGKNWISVCASWYNMSAIKTDGTLWVWGNNVTAQLGINSGVTARLTPVTTFAGGNNWKQVSVGLEDFAAIKTDGTLWVWGTNFYGTTGTNTTNVKSTPVTTIVGGTNWKQVSMGRYHTAAIKTDGTLWIWGNNSYGQLGINLAGALNGRSTPVTTFAGGTNWKQVSCGSFGFTSAIKTDGTLWVWGENPRGGMGTNDVLMKCTPVTTFAGGTNWKQVGGSGYRYISAITSGTDPTFFIS